MYYDVNVITEKMKQMFPKPLEKMYYNEIIDAIKKDKKYGFRHIALKIMVDGLEERTRDYKKYIDLQKEYFEFKHKYIETTQSLKQQVREEVVEEIKQQLFNHFKVKNIEEYEKLSLIDALFTADTVIEILDTILKSMEGKKMEKAICDECGRLVEIEDGEEWGYCPFCENDQVELKREPKEMLGNEKRR